LIFIPVPILQQQQIFITFTHFSSSSSLLRIKIKSLKVFAEEYFDSRMPYVMKRIAQGGIRLAIEEGFVAAI